MSIQTDSFETRGVISTSRESAQEDVLERALRDTVPAGLWWMSTFGAGFSCHGALLAVN